MDADDVGPVARRVPGLRDAWLTDGFWGRWSQVHRGAALDHQWRMLGDTGSLDAFALVAGGVEGYRTGEFFTDSDVYKWLDAASRALAHDPDPTMVARVDEAIALVEAAQDPDGYVNTWIQGLFPADRFANLDVHHELYTFGHLIEAAVSHHEATGSPRLLGVAERAAALMHRELIDAPAHRVDGHEEVELALVRLHRATGDPAPLELARRLVDRRGTAAHVRRRLAGSFADFAIRGVRQRLGVWRYARRHPAWRRPSIAPSRRVARPRGILRRTLADFGSGRNFQLDRPAREQVEPSGHSVRWLYLQVAMAMLAREQRDAVLREVTERAWEHFVEGHVFVNGGSGAFPLVEGFGDPYDLDPARAYAETCASVAGVLWNRELGLLTGDPRYDDLAEWQLLNGAGVGMGVDGTTYAYDNPLVVPPGVGRQDWFRCPCCPSNLSRVWASLATLQFSWTDDDVRVHQLFSGRARLGATTVDVDSALPWSGDVVVRVRSAGPAAAPPRHVVVRVPSWADEVQVTVDGVARAARLDERSPARSTASGLDPGRSTWCRVELPVAASCDVRLRFGMPVRLLAQDPRVPVVGGRVAVARGPLLYCLEGLDHHHLDGEALNQVVVDPRSFAARFDDGLLGGAVAVIARTPGGDDLRFVPYFLWGNRGATGMTTFVGGAGHSSGAG